MPYDANIPLATDNPSQSQGELLENFRQIQNQFGTNLSTGSGGDHVLLTSVSNNGRHNRLTLTNQAASPDSVKQAGVNEIRIYGKTVSGVTMPYYTRDNIPISTTEWPLSPIKAYASFAINTAGAIGSTNIVPDNSFNINSPIVQNIPGSALTQTLTFTMTNACRTSVYGVVFSLGFSLGGIIFFPFMPQYSITNSSTFVIYLAINTNAPNPLPPGRVTVMVLET